MWLFLLTADSYWKLPFASCTSYRKVWFTRTRTAEDKAQIIQMEMINYNLHKPFIILLKPDTALHKTLLLKSLGNTILILILYNIIILLQSVLSVIYVICPSFTLKDWTTKLQWLFFPHNMYFQHISYFICAAHQYHCEEVMQGTNRHLRYFIKVWITCVMQCNIRVHVLYQVIVLEE